MGRLFAALLGGSESVPAANPANPANLAPVSRPKFADSQDSQGAAFANERAAPTAAELPDMEPGRGAGPPRPGGLPRCRAADARLLGATGRPVPGAGTVTGCAPRGGVVVGGKGDVLRKSRPSSDVQFSPPKEFQG